MLEIIESKIRENMKKEFKQQFSKGIKEKIKLEIEEKVSGKHVETLEKMRKKGPAKNPKYHLRLLKL